MALAQAALAGERTTAYSSAILLVPRAPDPRDAPAAKTEGASQHAPRTPDLKSVDAVELSGYPPATT